MNLIFFIQILLAVDLVSLSPTSSDDYDDYQYYGDITVTEPEPEPADVTDGADHGAAPDADPCSTAGPEITPVAVKMSSVYKGDYPHPGGYCIDNNVNTFCHTAGNETWPWVALKIPRSTVQLVRITNRVDCGVCGERTKNLNVWVGENYPNTTDTPYPSGSLLGTFQGPAVSGQVIEVASDANLQGRYVVLQMHRTSYINLAEIAMFRYKEITPMSVKMSSVYFNLTGDNCIDNNVNTICATEGGETWPWVAVEIPRSTVQLVRITNGVDCCWEQTKNLKVWVGENYPTTSDHEYSSGSLLGSFQGPGIKGQVIEIPSDTNSQGGYVILQMHRTSYIYLAEIAIFGA